MKVRIVLLLCLICLTAFGQSGERMKLEKEKEALLSEIESTRKLLDQIQQTTSTTNMRLSLLKDQIKARMSVINILDKEVSQLDRDISVKGMQLHQLEKELEKKKQDYAETVEYMYVKRNSANRLLFILSAKDFSQAVRRFVYLREYSGSHKIKTDEIAAKQSEVMAQRGELERQKRSKKEVLDSRRKEEKELEVEESSLAVEMKNLQQEQKQIQAQLDKKQKEAERISNEIQRVIAEEMARAAREEAERLAREEALRKQEETQTAKGGTTKPKQSTSSAYKTTPEASKLSASFGSNKGKLPFPLKGSYSIINRFGKHASNRFPLNNIKGIDVATLDGTDALSVFEGEVVVVGEMEGYSRYVLVKHGSYYTLYQNLSRIYVKNGDKVKAGQALGRIYTDPSSRETILHFEIHEMSQKALNPELWLKK